MHIIKLIYSAEGEVNLLVFSFLLTAHILCTLNLYFVDDVFINKHNYMISLCWAFLSVIKL